MIPLCDCWTYETMFYQCSTENYMKSCFKATLLKITNSCGDLWQFATKTSQAKLICNFWLICLITANVNSMIQ